MLTQIVRLYAAFVADRRGVTALEYAVVAGVIVTVVLLGFQTFGNDLTNALAKIAGQIPG